MVEHLYKTLAGLAGLVSFRDFASTEGADFSKLRISADAVVELSIVPIGIESSSLSSVCGRGSKGARKERSGIPTTAMGTIISGGLDDI